jgi:hypothetical protein
MTYTTICGSILVFVLVGGLIANLWDYIDWVRAGKPKQTFDPNEFSGGDYD